MYMVTCMGCLMDFDPACEQQVCYVMLELSLSEEEMIFLLFPFELGLLLASVIDLNTHYMYIYMNKSNWVNNPDTSDSPHS